MHRLYIVLAMCCASFPCGSAAPTVRGEDPGSQVRGEDPGSQWKVKVEQDERLREEMDGQENILSKVGGKQPFSDILVRKIVNKKKNRCGKYIDALLFIAAG